MMHNAPSVRVRIPVEMLEHLKEYGTKHNVSLARAINTHLINAKRSYDAANKEQPQA